MNFLIKLLFIFLIQSSFLFPYSEEFLRNLTPLSFEISFQNFLNLYKEKNLNNLYGSNDSYSKYLRSAYQGLPYTRAYYFSEEIEKEPLNKAFLFYNDKLFLQSIQFITISNEYKTIITGLIKHFGQPSKQAELIGNKPTTWDFEDKQILISYTSPSQDKAQEKTDSLLLLLQAAFFSIEGVHTDKAKLIHQRLIDSGFLNNQGILIKDLSNEDILNFLNLTPLEKELVKVALLTTTYGEVNLVFVNKKILKEAMNTPL